MRASESSFQCYKSKGILYFANLICSSVSGPKALKNVSAFCHTHLQWKVMERFWNSIRKMWCAGTKIALIEKIFREKKFADTFLLFVLIYPPSKFGGNRTNSLWLLALYSVRFKWKNWFKKTALNVSIRRVIFTSGQNLKPPFLCQY